MDNSTGLMWTRNANMFGQRTWQQASDACNNLDFAGNKDWRLPKGFELESLFDVEEGHRDPALSNTAGTGKWTEGDPFTHQVSSYYWSATTHASSPIDAVIVDFYGGAVSRDHKSRYYYVWAVRSVQ